MKKFLLTVMSMILLLSLCACSQKSEVTTSTVPINGTTYIVDYESNTIFDGEHTYQFALSETSSGYSAEFIYPDGSTYWWKTHEHGGYGGWSEDYSAKRYVGGHVLWAVLETNIEKPKEVNGTNILVAIILLIVGFMNVASPHTAWYVEYGWRYKDAEPSELALTANRVGGVIALIIAVIVLLAAIF